jgi:hypothetical protein
VGGYLCYFNVALSYFCHKVLVIRKSFKRLASQKLMMLVEDYVYMLYIECSCPSKVTFIHVRPS